MKIGAYQFAVSGNINHNMEIIKKAIIQASREGVRLLVFPECALTGYPPRDMDKASLADFDELSLAYAELQKMAADYAICLIVGTITGENGVHYNSAIFFSPHQDKRIYHKRALWGWDRDNFNIGNEDGIFEIDGLKVGVRICFEVRFPEFFRELYKSQTDLNIILFYDVSDCDDVDRYELIKAHIRTRAVENVTYTLTVNSIYPYQTAPTAFYDKSGYPLMELKRNEEKLLIFDWKNEQADFGEQGRKEISDWLSC